MMLCARRFISAITILSLSAAQLMAQPAPKAEGELAV